MDERISGYKTGYPIPKWDLQHKLPTTIPVAQYLKDDATIFRINSTFMDVSEQPHLGHHWIGLALCPLAVGTTMSFFAAYLFSLSLINNQSEIFAASCLSIFTIIGIIFAYFFIKFGKDEYFSLTRKPIRFNRKEKRIYALRHRRFFSKPGQGDIVWEVPWNNESIFCIHKTEHSKENSYHIRCYIVDDCKNVIKAFSIGREWPINGGMESLLSQWNYWCWYMNNGPDDLPHPPLYFSEFESTLESFLFCMYEFSFRESMVFRIICMPYILILTFFRVLAKSTCRAPIWPADVEKVSAISPDDPYDQPSGNTPIGWAKTAIAREDGTYPCDPKRVLASWRGAPDGAVNAGLWATDVPPI